MTDRGSCKKMPGLSSNTDQSLDTRFAPCEVVFPNCEKICDPSGCTCVAIAEVHCTGRKIRRETGDISQGQVLRAVPGETSRLLQEGSCHALPVEYKHDEEQEDRLWH